MKYQTSRNFKITMALVSIAGYLTNEVRPRTLPLSQIAAASIRKKLFYSELTITTKQQTKIRLYPEQPEEMEKALISNKLKRYFIIHFNGAFFTYTN